MGLKYPVVATLLLFLVLVITCSGHTIHYIKPIPDSTCPTEPCLTLSEYAQQPHYYLISNTTLLFLPGDHILSVNFTVENVSSFEIHALLPSPTNNDQKSTVVCIGLVGLMFRNVSSMTLDGLTFHSCGNGVGGYGPVPDYLTAYGMLITLGEDIMIVNCSFEDSDGTALGVFYSNLHLHGNSFSNFCNGHSCLSHGGFFTNTRTGFVTANETNSVECGGRITTEKNTQNLTGSITFGENNSVKYSRGIYTYNSTLSLTGNILFGDNSAECGGGIKAKNSILNFIGNTAFRNNSATSGGGIYAYNSTLKFTGNIFFQDNSAEYGGGIRTLKSILHITGNSSFTDNAAEHYGGGIYVQSSTLISTGNSEFRDNTAMHGGGIGAVNSSLTFTGNNTLRDNAAWLGGGVYVSNSSVIFIGNSTIRDNSAWQSGGGIKATYSILNFTGNNTFRNNSADSVYGGAIIVDTNSTLRFTGNNAFMDNSAKLFGGGISVVGSTLDLIGDTFFTNNSATHGGGVDTLDSNLNFTGSNTFKINTAEYGGGICALKCTVKFLGNSTFENNSAALSGGGVKAFSSTLNFIGSSTSVHNSAIYGGGIYTEDSSVDIMGKSAFRNNDAEHCGGSIYALKSTLNIVGCSVDDNGGKYGDCSSCTLLVIHNSAELLGGAVYTSDSTLNFEGCSIFSGNSVKYCGGGVHAQNSTLKFSGKTTFSSNSAQYNGGGIHGLGATLYFSGVSSFTANTAGRGGGEYLANSFNLFSKNTTIDFVNNSATGYGGVVYVEDLNPITYCTATLFALDRCFFETYELFEIPQITPPNFIDDITHAVTAYYNIYIHFHNNHAQIAGSAVYGGAMDICHIHVDYNSTAELGTRFFQMYDVLNIELEPNSVSSDPFQVCPCEDGTPSCDTPELLKQIYPGELLPIPVVAVGQKNGVVPTVIRASFTGNSSLAQFQDTQEVKKNCTELHYQVRSSIVNNSDTLVLYADGPCSTAGNPLNISLHFLPCPPGFSLNTSDGTCGCEPRLHRYTTRCNITRRTLTREGEFWVGYDNDYDVVILHPHCPFDYCKPAKDHISFPLNNTDLQCENNRSGILCGGCKSGLSLALGSSKCLQCTNLHQLLFLPFALAGVALILLLLTCKLTVAAGTINGLIFYANIVRVNHAIFFPPNQTNILTVFISWVNLDIGFEVCFFDGMDEYSKTWMQFIFPLYVWSIVVLIIIASEYSSRISRLFGSNPVAVLATLFLLSYGKLLRTVITAMFFTNLDYSNEVNAAVWLCDGNIQYLHGKHIALFLAALMTLLIFVFPYTLLLTVGQWLQANSNRRFFHWINKPRIKPFLDAYQAPYRDQHRYWTGLLLCLRCALFLVFAFNTQADPSINLLAISSAAFGLTLMTRYTGAVYSKLHVDILEASFILNTGILALATYYVKHAVVPVNQAAVVYTSVGIAFATFIGVIFYHTYKQIWPKLQQRIHHLHDHQDRKCSNSEEERNANRETPTLASPTTTIVDRPCPESLDIGGSRSRPFITPYTNFIELREPLQLIETDDS